MAGSLSPRAKAFRVFCALDVDRDGRISHNDLQSHVQVSPSGLSDDTLARLIDAGGEDGSLDFHCFFDLIAAGWLKELLANEWLADTGQPASPEQLCGGPAAQDAEDNECPICVSHFWHPVTATCGHTFCHECISMWLKNKSSCPLCRASLRGWRIRPPELGTCIHMWENKRHAGTMSANSGAASAEERQSRLMELVPQGRAFILRIGHRPFGDAETGIHILYAQPEDPDLPLQQLVREVCFELRPEAQDGRLSLVEAPKPSGAFEVYKPEEDIDSFKVHIIWRDGLPMNPVSVGIHACLANSQCTDKRFAVALPETTAVSDRLLRRSLGLFREKVAELHGAEAPRSRRRRARSIRR